MVKLNPYVLADEPNEVSLEVAPPDGQPSHEPSAALGVRVLEGAEGGTSADARVVFEQLWSQRDAPAVGPLFMSVLSAEIKTSVSYGRWAWQDATPFTPADRSDIEALVKRIHSGFSSGNYSALAALTKVRDEEMARGMDLSYAELEGHSRGTSANWFGADDYQVAPLDLSVMQLQPRAAGRLVEVTDERGLPLIRVRVDGRRAATAVYAEPPRRRLGRRALNGQGMQL